MKSEIEIAKENFHIYMLNLKPKWAEDVCQEHKQACERFLIWLKRHRDSDLGCYNLKSVKCKNKKFEEGYKASLECQIGIYNKKINEIQEAIKVYEGITL